MKQDNMNDISIRVENIGKKFRIGRAERSYRTLRDTITDAFSAPFRKADRLLRGRNDKAPESDEIWALEDVCFEVKSGEVLGIIGRNGAILGMGREEIKRKFDEIVSFAEVEKFVDTPVKRFSSGMYLRLAFAVAAHLDPEILIVDEVLAVGDSSFQKKCLNKMEDIGQRGRTVLFVSHSMPAITRLCKRAILLEDGTVKADGLSHQVVSRYLNNGFSTSSVRYWPDAAKAPGGDIARLRSIEIINDDGKITDSVDISQTFGIRMEYEVLKPGHVLMPYHHIFNEDNVNIFQAHDTDAEWQKRPRPAGHYHSTVWIYGNLLAEGMLYISSGITRVDVAQPQFYEKDAVTVQVFESLDNVNSARGEWTGDMGGVVRPFFKWNTQYNPNNHRAHGGTELL